MSPKLLQKTSEKKVTRDPIHGYITITRQVIWDALQTREFQRLHRVHQLGGDFQVYPAAEHSRFVHSLGVYEIVRRITEENESVSAALSEEEKVIVQLAGLLHDLGHGPFSHSFEKMSGISHEEMTWQLLLDEESEIGALLRRVDSHLAEQVVSVLNHTHPHQLLSDLVSSQLDADRMDYLLRDAYFSGTTYGHFDLERVLRTLRTWNGRLAVKASGIHAVEDYILARYQMYHQAYLHPDACGYEWLVCRFFQRLREVRNEQPVAVMECFFEQPMTSSTFWLLDESRFFTGLQESLHHPDDQLRFLADAILNRKLPDWAVVEQDQVQEISEKIARLCSDRHMNSIWLQDLEEIRPCECLPYTEEDSRPVLVLSSDEELLPLSQASAIARALLLTQRENTRRVFFPKSLRMEVRQLLQQEKARQSEKQTV